MKVGNKWWISSLSAGWWGLMLLHASVCFNHYGKVSAYYSGTPHVQRRGIAIARCSSNFPSNLFASQDKADDGILEQQIWDFQGHQCYAQVSRPNYPTTMMLPFEAAAARFSVFGDSVMGVWKGLGSSLEPKNPKKKSIISSSGFIKKRPEVVLIHGFGCSTTYWRETRKALVKAGYTVHSLDLLGLGKSAKPGRAENVEYSIDLWAKMVEEYTQTFIPKQNRIVIIGNSLGSVVALSAATGDYVLEDDNDPMKKRRGATSLSSRIQGIGMFNCGVGMNSRNLLKDPNLNSFQRVLFAFLFDSLDKLIFDNVPLLRYLLEDVVTKDLLRNALLGLYQCSPDPELRVDDELVESFYLPAKDAGSVEALNQIYTNDAGKTPMQFHKDYAEFFRTTPLHLVWGTADQVTPLEGTVGQFYMGLANNPEEPVSINVLKAGHIPFDEIPECNESMVQWLEDIVLLNQPGN